MGKKIKHYKIKIQKSNRQIITPVPGYGEYAEIIELGYEVIFKEGNRSQTLHLTLDDMKTLKKKINRILKDEDKSKV